MEIFDSLPLYSVLMSLYKGDNEYYLETSLLSMVRQTCKPAEIVIVCDGEVRSEQEIIIDRIKKNTNIPIVIEKIKKNSGLGNALKIGVEKCKYDLIARMDADDYSCPNRCEKQLIEFAKDEELAIIGCSVIEFSGDITNVVGYRCVPEMDKEIKRFSKLRNPFNHPSVMFRKKKVLEVGNYKTYRKNQDLDLWMRMIKKNMKCKNLPLGYFYFRFDADTYRKRKSWVTTKNLIAIRFDNLRNNQCGIKDFLIVCLGQMLRFLLPAKSQQVIYRIIKR